ncbi:MAG TPA: hypothetical protein VGO11_20005 [Chthoniobacteraceae bacterium]|jgi:hypothetical protein|nr:hypothetical protein [Chthoniobacteraceae bacterium]
MNPDGAAVSEIEWLLAALREKVKGTREMIEESRDMVEQSRLMAANAHQLVAETNAIVRRAREHAREMLGTIRPCGFLPEPGPAL